MKVFISYRRDDTKDIAGRFADRLRQTRGISRVFIDVEEIGAGADFLRAIKQALEASAVRFVLIGKQWSMLNDAEGRPRILDPEDYVGLEIRAALSSPGKTIPVLVNGASMPRHGEIPSDLHPLLQLNSSRLNHESFDADFEALAAAALGRRLRRPSGNWFARRPLVAAVSWSILGLVISAMSGLLILLANSQMDLFRLPLGGSREAATLIVALWLLFGTFAPGLWRLNRSRL